MLASRLATIARYGVAFDTETHLTQPGLDAPPIVCGSVADSKEPTRGAILSVAQARETFDYILNTPIAVLIGQNIAYDNLVMSQDAYKRGIDLLPAIFKMYDEGRVYDIAIAEQLHAIAQGHLMRDPRTGYDLRDPETGQTSVGYRLSVLLDLVCDRRDAKENDRFRKSYALLEDIPIEEWPPDARKYPVDDAVNTLQIALTQIAPPPQGTVYPSGGPGSWPARNRNLHDLSRQADTAWCLKLADAQGLHVDPPYVKKLEADVDAARVPLIGRFRDLDFFKIAPYKKRCKTEHLEPHECPECLGGSIGLTDTGAEQVNKVVIKLLICDAYGVGGVCSNCQGARRVPGLTKCQGCEGTGDDGECLPCNGIGKVPNLKKDGTPKSLRGCPKCDGTGRDLDTAPIPRSEKTGAVQVGRDDLTESGVEELIDFAEFLESAKIKSTYIPWLKKGINAEGGQVPLTQWSNVMLATGRISYNGCTVTLPRKGGVREALVAPEGWVYFSCDYSGLELITHAQSCLDILGWSKMAEALNGGVKVHDLLGSDMSGIPYEDFLKRRKAGEKQIVDYRQAAKPGNFGFPGGMGAAKMVKQQRKADFDTTGPDGTKYKGLRFCILIGGAERCGIEKVTQWGRSAISPTCKHCIECAETLRDTWFKTFPENRPYLNKYVNGVVRGDGEVTQFWSERVRGGLDFCAAANTRFQGLGADVTKLALRRVTREQYVDRSSALFGSRTLLMPHDELFGKVRIEQAHEACMRLQAVMEGALKELCPDLADAAEAEPCLMPRWYKGAEPKWLEGRLIPWTPKEA